MYVRMWKSVTLNCLCLRMDECVCVYVWWREKEKAEVEKDGEEVGRGGEVEGERRRREGKIER